MTLRFWWTLKQLKFKVKEERVLAGVFQHCHSSSQKSCVWVGGKHELSEMFIVRNTYSDKAEQYVRMHGHLNFGPGGAFHDVSEMIKEHGIVPLETYSGNPSNEEKFNHGEMDHILFGMVKAVVDAEQKTLTPLWKNGLRSCFRHVFG